MARAAPADGGRAGAAQLMGVLLQSLAAIRLSIRALPRRRHSAMTTILSIALVVLVLAAFLAMGRGFRAAVTGGSSTDVAIIMARGARHATGSVIDRSVVTALEGAPGIDAISPEIFVSARARRRSGDEASLALHGLPLGGRLARQSIVLEAGHMPRPGTREALAGVAAAREFADMAVGESVSLGGDDWRITGHFSAGGSLSESELRVDLPVLQAQAQRGTSVQIVRVRLIGAEGYRRLRQWLGRHPQLQADMRTEPQYFAAMAQAGGAFILRLGWPLGIVMAIGALAGAANALYASIAARTGEIVTLRILGFARVAIICGVMAEAMCLALVGAMIGLLAAWLVFDGREGVTMAASLNPFLFRYHLAAPDALAAAGLALTVGLLGGLFPAWHAIRIPLVAVGRD